MITMTDLCMELRNFFDRGKPKYFGNFEIVNGALKADKMSLVEGQYYRITGSLFNDGVHIFQSEESLRDESFSGSVRAMAVPPDVIALVGEINNWLEKYEETINKPFSSETISGVYSYTKASGGRRGDDGSSPNIAWQDVFATKLNKWRKI